MPDFHYIVWPTEAEVDTTITNVGAANAGKLEGLDGRWAAQVATAQYANLTAAEQAAEETYAELVTSGFVDESVEVL
jgi:hypothetical protein